MLGFLPQLFEIVDLQLQSLSLFPEVSFVVLKTQDLGLAGILGSDQGTEPSRQPTELASLGADQAVELAPRRIDHRNRIRNELGSVLDHAVQAKVFAHVTKEVFLRPSGE